MVMRAAPWTRSTTFMEHRKIAANQTFENSNRQQLKHAPVALDAPRRKVGSSATVRERVITSLVEEAVRGVCGYRKYILRALNARTNHVHCVVTARCEPEPVLDAFQAYATRALRRAGLIGMEMKPWARHGSTIYPWKEKHVAKAIEYVMLGQGDELFRLDDD